MPSGIAYSLSYNETLKVYLPLVYVVGLERDGELGYMERRGTLEVLENYSFFDPEGPHKPLVALCEELHPEVLRSRFVKSKKLSLAKALEDKIIKKAVLRGVGKQVDQFLRLVIQNGFPLCLEIERQENLEKRRIVLSDEAIEPKLYFTKTESGIDYTLAIRDKNIQWYPSERNVILINDQPGWITANGRLYQIRHVNGNKLKPFLNKLKVHIPDRIAHKYLEKFVKDIITKVSVKAEGFDIHKHDLKPTAELKFRKNFMSEEWMMELMFHYGDEMFAYRLPERSRTKLQYDGNSEVSFSVVERQDDAELNIIRSLQKAGLSLDDDKRFRIKNSKGDDPFELILWGRDHMNEMGRAKIKTSLPVFNEKQLGNGSPSLRISQVENNDWFDIHGIVKIDGHEILFKDLVESIRNDERIFELPDGTCFIIPLEWMTKYSGLARWAKEEDDGVKILRSQFTLMDDEMTEGQSTVAYKAIESDIDYVPSALLKATLRPYQLDGTRWLVNHQISKLGCCLADDMGLGKTLQTLGALLYAKENNDSKAVVTDQFQLNLFEQQPATTDNVLLALVVMPASLIFNWYNEINKFAPHLRVLRHMGPKRLKKEERIRGFDVILTSYHTALRDEALLQQIEWSYIVLDESQYIKNHNSKIFGAIRNFNSIYKLSLSGTPIENSLSDLWSQMEFINPEILGTYQYFKKHFQIPIERYQDEDLLEELKKMIRPYILRRTKDEVLKDLPEKIEQVIYCEMSSHQKNTYEKEKSAARNLILQSDMSDPQVRMQVFTSLLRLRQLANHPVLFKKNYKHDSGKFEVLTENLLKVEKSKNKALIFSSFTGHLDLVASFFEEQNISFVTLTGKSSQKARQKAVEEFQENKEILFFLISIKAGGTGLNLTAADYVFILDPWWNPFAENQAIARAHRIGLDHPLSVLRYITTDSIEEKIMKLQKKKRAMAADLLEATGMPDWNKDEIDYILE